MASDLPANARLVALVLCAATARGTVVVPPEFSPSLDRLASRTGLGRATVARELNRLEADGWATRHRSSGQRTWYTLAAPTSPTAGRVPERDGYGSQSGTGTGPTAGPNQKCFSEGSSAAAAELSEDNPGDSLDGHEPGIEQTGHDQAPAVEVDPHADVVQALTGDAGIPASWAGDVQAALGRGCTPGQIADAYRAPITGAVRNPTAIRRARIRDLTPEPARPAAPSAHVPPNVRSMCRRHGLPGPCPVCADLEAGRADDVEVVVLVGLAVLLSQDDPPAAEQPAPTLTPTASATVVPDYADPAPSADNPSRFIREARMIGFQSESDLIAAGRAVCAGVASGTQSSAFAEAAAWLDALSLSADQRTVLIAMSAENLCPQYRS